MDDPENYWFSKRTGRTIYYFKGKVIAVKNIPVDIKLRIKELTPLREAKNALAKLLERQKELDKEIKEAERIVAEEEKKEADIGTKKVSTTSIPLTPIQFLASHNIYDLKSWHKWLLKNHPDKIAPSDNSERYKEAQKLCQSINQAISDLDWQNKK
jgi:hypothetical protein